MCTCRQKKATVAFSRIVFIYFGFFPFLFWNVFCKVWAGRWISLTMPAKWQTAAKLKAVAGARFGVQTQTDTPPLGSKTKREGVLGVGGGVGGSMRSSGCVWQRGSGFSWRRLSEREAEISDVKRMSNPNMRCGHPITHVWLCRNSRWGQKKMFQLQLWIHFDHWKSVDVFESFGVVFQHVARGTYEFSQIEEPEPSCPRICWLFLFLFSRS